MGVGGDGILSLYGNYRQMTNNIKWILKGKCVLTIVPSL